MKRSILNILPLAVWMIISGCKKQESDTLPQKQIKQTDQAANTEADEAIDQVKDVIDNRIGGGNTKRVAAADLPCGVVSIDSSATSQGNKIYKMNYGAKTRCGYKYKSGLVSFGLIKGAKFNEAGAVYSVTFIDYKVEGNASGNEILLNGVLSINNVTGGYVWQAVTEAKTIQHRLRGTISIRFANNEVRERKLYRLRTFKNAGTGWAGLTLEISGDTSINSMLISETGKTYEGNYDFKTEMADPFSWSNCGTNYAGPYVLKKGKAKMHVTVPMITPTYIEVEAGYKWNYNVVNNIPDLVNSCEANAYKITSVIGQNLSIGYQLY